jgi:GAF domain-containing protein
MSSGCDVDDTERESAAGPAGLDTVFRGLTQAARQIITGVDHASLTVMRPNGDLETVAPTGDLIVRADALQYRNHEGPCVLAVETGKDIVAGQVASDGRFPRYGPDAGELGIIAQVALPLQGEGRVWGALNLYSLVDGAFDDVSLQTGELLASSAAALLGLTRQVSSLSAALSTRTTIGTAIGIVMEHYGIGENRAFNFLVRRSQNANVKLRLVAHDIVAEVERTGGFNG